MHPVQGMALYLKSNYVFFEGRLAGKKLIWAKVQQNADLPPDRLQNQKLQLERLLGLPVVFVFDHLDSWQRKRLIERYIGFIQTGKQVYIPEWLLQLGDIRPAYKFSKRQEEQLSFPAQVAVLYQLQHKILDGRAAQEIAGRLGYSAMTISRVGRELEYFGLVTLQAGKERAMEFSEKGEALWRQALPLLRNPVKEEWYAYDLAGMSQISEAGESALASYSVLAEGRVRSVAIGKEQFRSLQTLKRLPELNKHQGNYCLQVWHYDPAIVAGPGNSTVDKLSLYLTLMSTHDERLQAALTKMINEILW